MNTAKTLHVHGQIVFGFQDGSVSTSIILEVPNDDDKICLKPADARELAALLLQLADEADATLVKLQAK
jgi:hypothetical protein